MEERPRKRVRRVLEFPSASVEDEAWEAWWAQRESAQLVACTASRVAVRVPGAALEWAPLPLPPERAREWHRALTLRLPVAALVAARVTAPASVSTTASQGAPAMSQVRVSGGGGAAWHVPLASSPVSPIKRTPPRVKYDLRARVSVTVRELLRAGVLRAGEEITYKDSAQYAATLRSDGQLALGKRVFSSLSQFATFVAARVDPAARPTDILNGWTTLRCRGLTLEQLRRAYVCGTAPPVPIAAQPQPQLAAGEESSLLSLSLEARDETLPSASHTQPIADTSDLLLSLDHDYDAPALDYSPAPAAPTAPADDAELFAAMWPAHDSALSLTHPPHAPSALALTSPREDRDVLWWY